MLRSENPATTQIRQGSRNIGDHARFGTLRRASPRRPKPTASEALGGIGRTRRCFRECPITYTTRSSLGYERPQRKITTTLRLRQPRRVIVPLSADQVARFWKGFRTFRDLAIVALMLQDGLRSCEVLQLQLEDLVLSEAHFRVSGKGRAQRVLPLSADTLQVLENYLHLERPLTNSSALFVSLKGRRRGRPMTAAGLRSLFRHHRLISRVPLANPHRLRHTFGSDMVRAGISLPALMHLMGHAKIQTTMLYVQIAPQDVWREYARAIQQRLAALSLPEKMP